MSASLGLNGKKVIVLGANPSGVALVKYLSRQNALVTLVDPAVEELVRARVEEFVDLSKVQLECGDLNPKTFEAAEIVLVTAGLPLDLPALEAARTAGVQVMTELEFASLYSNVPFIAVAGTKGKSTTAFLLQKILEAAGKSIFTNVDAPLSEVLNSPKKLDYVVSVATSFQLEGTSTFKPKMLLFLNIAEDHMDRYPNFETYLSANREVFKNNCAESVNILNGTDPQVKNTAQMIAGRNIFFGDADLPQGAIGAWVPSRHDITFRYAEGSITKDVTFSLKDFRLRGPHNRENLMAAGTAALILGAKPEHIQAVINTVSALPHRMEFVRRLNAVAFYNDSSAGNPTAVIKSLAGFHEPVILIAGGKDKNLDFTPLIPHIRQRVKNLILVGEAKEKVNRSIGDYTETFLVGTLEEAILLAYQKSRSGDVILLSPGCAATDQFATHAERGEYFKKVISQIAQPRRPNVL